MIKFEVKQNRNLELNLKKLVERRLAQGQVNVGVNNPETLEAAWVNEIGTTLVPATNFLTTAIFSNKSNYARILKKDYRQISSGTMSIDVLLSKIGTQAVLDVKKYMMELKTPPNAASTIKLKGFDNRLVTDDNDLINSITYEIVT